MGLTLDAANSHLHRDGWQVETIVAQRRRMILTTADFAGYEVQRELDALRGGSGLAARLRQDPPAHQQALALAPDDLSAGLCALTLEL